MKTIYLSKLFPRLDDAECRRRMFALLNLGMIEWLNEGTLTPDDAIRFFYNAENCRFVRDDLRDKTADEIMGRGVQLPDLFEILPQRDAFQEFQHELQTMRSLCTRLLKVGSPRRAGKRAAVKH